MPITPGRCQDCNKPTPIINRVIGFFGMREIYSQYCRICIGQHAHEYDLNVSPGQLRKLLDEAEKDERERHAKKQKTKTTQQETFHDT